MKTISIATIFALTATNSMVQGRLRVPESSLHRPRFLEEVSQNRLQLAKESLKNRVPKELEKTFTESILSGFPDIERIKVTLQDSEN